MKSIYITKEQFDYLTNIAKTNREEISGTISTNNIENRIYFDEIVFNTEDEVESKSEHSIVTNPKYYTFKIFKMLEKIKGDYIIGFHTHPHSQIKSNYSNADAKFIRYYQIIINGLIAKGNERKLLNVHQDIYYVECIIHTGSLSFWYYNKEKDKAEEINFYVDDKLVDNNRENSILKAIRIGFTSGLSESKRRRQ